MAQQEDMAFVEDVRKEEARKCFETREADRRRRKETGLTKEEEQYNAAMERLKDAPPTPTLGVPIC